MSLSNVTVAFNVHDWFGGSFDVRRAKAWATNNADDQKVDDTSTGESRIGSGVGTIAADGTGTFTHWAPGADGNPTSWQTSYHFDVPDKNAPNGRRLKTFGPFTVTGTSRTVTNKALTTNVATLTTSTAHKLVVGNTITVAITDAVFDGTHTVTAVPSTTTISYAKTNANVTSAAATGTLTSPNVLLTSLEQEQAIPATYLSTTTALLDSKVAAAQTARTGAETARTGAEAAEDAAQALVLSDLGTTDGQTRALIENPASQVSGALSATYGPATGPATGFPTSFVANGTGNIIEAIATRAADPINAHVEGRYTEAYGRDSHAEGIGSMVDGKISHAEGNNSICSANDSHAEGNITNAGRRLYTGVTTGSEDAGDGLGVLQYVIIPDTEGDVSSGFPNPLTADVVTRYGTGYQKDVKGNIYSNIHTPAVWTGDVPTTPNDLQWALHPVAILRGSEEGQREFVTIAKAVYTGGAGTKVYYLGAKPFTTVTGILSSYSNVVWFGGTGQHSEGAYTSTSGTASHAEGLYSRAWGSVAHAEGNYTRATGDYSHAEGHTTKATAVATHAEGYFTEATGTYSHAEGWTTKATGTVSHAEGDSTIASGAKSHAEGEYTTASGQSSHAEGTQTLASGTGSRASGLYSVASRSYQDAYSPGRRVAGGDCQTSRIGYQRSCVGAGWHVVKAFTTLVNDRSYHFETMVIGRQTATTGGGTVGDTFAYKFSGAVTVTGGVMTVLGTIARTLVGRSAGMAGDGLTTGVRMNSYGLLYAPGDLVLQFDSIADATYHVQTYTTVQELA